MIVIDRSSLERAAKYTSRSLSTRLNEIFQSSVLVAELLVLLDKKRGLSVKDRMLFEALISYLTPPPQIKSLSAMDLARVFHKAKTDFSDPEIAERVAELQLRLFNKKNTKWYWYNKVCDKWPQKTYAEINEYLFRGRDRFGRAILRQYKRRRILNTGDFREETRLKQSDIRFVRDLFLSSEGSSMTLEELIRRSRLREVIVRAIVERFEKQGKISRPTRNGETVITYTG